MTDLTIKNLLNSKNFTLLIEYRLPDKIAHRECRHIPFNTLEKGFEF